MKYKKLKSQQSQVNYHVSCTQHEQFIYLLDSRILLLRYRLTLLYLFYVHVKTSVLGRVKVHFMFLFKLQNITSILGFPSQDRGFEFRQLLLRNLNTRKVVKILSKKFIQQSKLKESLSSTSGPFVIHHLYLEC